MKPLFFAGIVGVLALGLTKDAVGCDWEASGRIAWRSPFHNSGGGIHAPYFVTHPPVYYIFPILRTCRPSASACLNWCVESTSSSCADWVSNQFCEASDRPANRPSAKKPLRIANPYVEALSDSEIAERIQQATGRKPLTIYPAALSKERS